MNSEMTDLAREAVACVPIEEWPTGAKLILPDGYLGVFLCGMPSDNPGTKNVQVYDGKGIVWFRGAELLPDLESPATIGCLLHLVREVWDDNGAFTQPHPHFLDEKGQSIWVVTVGGRDLPMPSKGQHNEAHALVAALKAGGGR